MVEIFLFVFDHTYSIIRPQAFGSSDFLILCLNSSVGRNQKTWVVFDWCRLFGWLTSFNGNKTQVSSTESLWYDDWIGLIKNKQKFILLLRNTSCYWTLKVKKITFLINTLCNGFFLFIFWNKVNSSFFLASVGIFYILSNNTSLIKCYRHILLIYSK